MKISDAKLLELFSTVARIEEKLDKSALQMDGMSRSLVDAQARITEYDVTIKAYKTAVHWLGAVVAFGVMCATFVITMKTRLFGAHFHG